MRRLILWCAILLGLCGSAQATQINSVTAAGWDVSDGLALTKALSGPDSTHQLNDMTSSGWTIHKFSGAAISAPTGSSATGYAESAANTELYFQPDATTTWNAGLADYWIDFWVRGQYDETTSMGTSQILQSSILPIISSGSFARIKWIVNPASGYTPRGFALAIQNTGTNGSDASYHLDLLATSTGVVHAPWNAWNRITIHFHYGSGSAGFVETYINGTISDRQTGDTAFTDSTAAHLNRVQLPAVPGVKWQITGPINTWSGTDITVTPVWALNSTDPVQRIYQPFATYATGGQSQGMHFVSSGTGTTTRTSYSTTGTSPYRYRHVFSGTAQSPVVTTTDELGSLTYNAQGWATIVFTDAYCPQYNSLQMQVYKSGGTDNLFSLKMDYTGSTSTIGYIYDASTTFATNYYVSTSRYTVMLHLNRDGRARYTMLDQTTQNSAIATVAAAFSGLLPDWTPQTLGKVCITNVASATRTNAAESGAVVVAPRPTIALLDSMASLAYTTPTIPIRTADRVGRGFPYGSDHTSIPGAYYPMKELGMARRVIVTHAGTNGLKRADWMNVFAGGMHHTCGCEFLLIDGGAINDIGNNSTTPADLDTAVGMLVGSLESWLQRAVENDNAVLMTTTLQRTYDDSTHATVSGDGTAGGHAYTAVQRGYIDAWNGYVRAAPPKFQSKGLISIADIDADKTANAANYPDTTAFWTDNTHPVALTITTPYTASGYIAKRIYQLAKTPPSVAPVRRLPGSLVGRN